MAEGQLTMFGKTYNSLGSTDNNLILLTKGDLKVQWGNRFIDLIKNGKVNTEDSLPRGTILMYNGTSIPEGFAICNGSNGTPNLTDKFIKASTSPGKTSEGVTSSEGENVYALTFIMKI